MFSKMLNNLNFFNTIKKKILISNGVLLVILLVVLIFALSQLQKNQELLFLEEEAVTKLTEVEEIEEEFLNFRLASAEFIIMLQDHSKEERDSSYQELLSLIAKSSQENMTVLLPLIEEYHQQVLQTTVAFIDNEKMRGSLLLNQSVLKSDEILERLKGQRIEHKQLVNTIVQSVHLSNSQVSFSLYLLLATMLLVGIGVSLFLANLIGRALVKLQGVVEKVENDGDLTLRATINSNDEIGNLAGAFNRLVANLANIVREVKDKSVDLATTAEELSSVTQQTSTGMQQQSDEISQVATAMTEMSATVNEVASNTELASSSAQEGNREAETGSKIVEQTIVAIGELANEVQSSSGVIGELSADSVNIGSMLDVIKNIAEQTNLLALNAAIEAARAGEQGRGFAVVADEVRTLAQRTQDSTLEIESLVESLQGRVEKAVKVMGLSQEKAEKTVEQAHSAGDSLGAITQSVANILDMSTQIACASEQQAATAGEINRNINNIQSIAESTASGAKQTADSSTQLSELSLQLRNLVGQFKV